MQELNGAINLPRLGVKPEPQPTCTLGGLTRARQGEIKMPPRGPAGQAPGPAWASCSPSSSRERPVHGSLVRVSVPSRHGCALPAACSSRACYPSEPGSRRSPAVAPSPASFPVTCGHTRCLEPAARRLRELCRPRAGSLCPSSPAGKAPGPGREEHPGWPPAAGTGSGPKAHASVWSRSQQALEASPTPHSSALSFLHAEGQVRSTGGGSPV